MSYIVNTHLADNHYICTPGNHAETKSLYRFRHNLLPLDPQHEVVAAEPCHPSQVLSHSQEGLSGCPMDQFHICRNL